MSRGDTLISFAHRRFAGSQKCPRRANPTDLIYKVMCGHGVNGRAEKTPVWPGLRSSCFRIRTEDSGMEVLFSAGWNWSISRFSGLVPRAGYSRRFAGLQSAFAILRFCLNGLNGSRGSSNRELQHPDARGGLSVYLGRLELPAACGVQGFVRKILAGALRLEMCSYHAS